METIARFEHSYFLTVNGEGRLEDNPCIRPWERGRLGEPAHASSGRTTEGSPTAGPSCVPKGAELASKEPAGPDSGPACPFRAAEFESPPALSKLRAF